MFERISADHIRSMAYRTPTDERAPGTREAMRTREGLPRQAALFATMIFLIVVVVLSLVYFL
jgi:hypothetical protein